MTTVFNYGQSPIYIEQNIIPDLADGRASFEKKYIIDIGGGIDLDILELFTKEEWERRKCKVLK